MTDDQVALDDRYPVAGAEPASAVPARLLGHPTRVALPSPPGCSDTPPGSRSSATAPRVAVLRPDGREAREPPVAAACGTGPA
jgi:hypothetical protein